MKPPAFAQLVSRLPFVNRRAEPDAALEASGDPPSRGYVRVTGSVGLTPQS